jgi:hypothetical protein
MVMGEDKKFEIYVSVVPTEPNGFFVLILFAYGVNKG